MNRQTSANTDGAMDLDGKGWNKANYRRNGHLADGMSFGRQRVGVYCLLQGNKKRTLISISQDLVSFLLRFVLTTPNCTHESVRSPSFLLPVPCFRRTSACRWRSRLLLLFGLLVLSSSPSRPTSAYHYPASLSIAGRYPITIHFFHSSATMSSTSLSATLPHAVSFLISPLLSSYTAATIIKLGSVLEANLTSLYATTWSEKEPLRGSARRCLTLSPNCLPPRSIYAACIATGIQWFDWIEALGGREFELFVDPGCVAIRYASKAGTAASQMITIWAGEVIAPALPTPRTGLASFEVAQNAAVRGDSFDNMTKAQRLLVEDAEEDEQLFNLINGFNDFGLTNKSKEATWAPPIKTHFVVDMTRSPSPLSSISTESRCSSRSSNSSSSSFSDVYSATSYSASSLLHVSAGDSRRSHREKSRSTRVFVDNSKTDVTPYDGGKTTVLTGGVMLGGGPKPQKPKKSASPPSSSSWRSVRA